MKKVLFGLLTTAAVIALTYVLIRSMFIAYPTWFKDLTRYVFIGQIDYYASIGIDLYEFRVWSAVSYVLGMTVLSTWAVAEVIDIAKTIGRAIFGVKAA